MTSEAWIKLSIEVFGGLGVFLYGMRVMSRGLESVGSEKMRVWLQTFTSHPLAGVMTGVLVTSVIQSSSATTVMVVGLTHAGFLSLTQAISVIMGANIGTTMTGWIVALLGFKVDIAQFALPVIGFGVVFIFLGMGKKRGTIGEILVGFGLLFLGLMFMKNAVEPLSKSSAIQAWMQQYSASAGLGNLILTVLFGALLTVIIQSSSATMALTMTLAGQGLIDFPTATALILGENIGTTVTANLAAFGTHVAARRAAFVHFLFNVFGVIWAIALFSTFLRLIDWAIPGDPFAKDLAARSRAIADHMAAFHTVFNIINTFLFFFLINQLAALVTRLLPEPPENLAPKTKILYLDTGLMATPSLAMEAVRRELRRMLQKCQAMQKIVVELIKTPDDLEKGGAEILRYESMIDELEKEITMYLVDVTKNELSAEVSRELAACMHMAHDLEKIGDSCETLYKLLLRRKEQNLNFSELGIQGFFDISAKTRGFLELLEKHIAEPHHRIMEEAYPFEDDIDNLRNRLRDEHIARLVDGQCDARAGLVYIDMIGHFEKIGDHCFNIAQYISEIRV